MDNREGFKVLRSTSVRLRKRKDQARRNFLRDRRSGEFGYSSNHDGWSYVSFNPPVNRGEGLSSEIGRAGGSLSMMCDNSGQKYTNITRREVLSDSEEWREKRRPRNTEKKLWRKSVIGIEEPEKLKAVVYKDFGLIDSPKDQRIEIERTTSSLGYLPLKFSEFESGEHRCVQVMNNLICQNYPNLLISNSLFPFQ